MGKWSHLSGIPGTAIARQAKERREEREFEQAREELGKVAPETAAIVEGWAKLWRPSDAPRSACSGVRARATPEIGCNYCAAPTWVDDSRGVVHCVNTDCKAFKMPPVPEPEPWWL